MRLDGKGGTAGGLERSRLAYTHPVASNRLKDAALKMNGFFRNYKM
jgi:hypothetical protein